MPRNDLIQLRSDTAANWASVNPTLAVGETGFETDTGKLKVGTGSTAWNSLIYVTDASDLAGIIPSARISGSYTGITGLGTLASLTIDGPNSPSFTLGDTGFTGYSGITGDKGYLLVGNSGGDSVMYLRTVGGGGPVYIGQANSNTLQVGNGTATVAGTMFATTFSGSGASLTSLPANQLTGTISSLRLSGTYTGIQEVGTLNSLTIGGPGANRTITINAPTGYYAIQYFQIGGVYKWHYEVNPAGDRWSLVQTGVAERIGVTSAGATFSGALNAYSISGNSNVAGTGNASYHPSGVYSTGTNWLYGTVLTNGSDIGSGGQYVGAVYSNNFFRSSGTTGWYSETYGGGIHMIDTTWVRTYNAKGIYTGAGQFHNARTSGWGATYDSGAGYFYAGSGPVNLGFYHVTGTNIVLNESDTTFYFRNSNNSQYVGVAAIIYNQSSRELKQDIVNFPQKLKSVGSAVNPLLEESALDIVEKLQPRFYRWDYEKTFGDELPREERRRKALSRLNKIRKEKGIEPFMSDETLHKCGRDCDAPDGEVCNRVKDWKNGSIGFVAEEVGEVIPQAARYDMDGKYTSVDSVALNAICVAAIKELKERLEKLEESNV